MYSENQQWALEYSEICEKDGLCPFHYISMSDPRLGRSPHHWKIIFIGTLEQVITKAEKIRLSDNKKKERSKMTNSLRYNILQRDEFKCKICGRTSENNIKLEVDHIVPISKGGKTTTNNLQTLCRECNSGKGI